MNEKAGKEKRGAEEKELKKRAGKGKEKQELGRKWKGKQRELVHGGRIYGETGCWRGKRWKKDTGIKSQVQDKEANSVPVVDDLPEKGI